MIRDPSDGSVREITAEEDQLLRKATIASGAVVQSDLGMPISGLPAGSAMPERQAQLERSREWVRSFHAKKNV